MLKHNELPEDVASVVLLFTHFIRDEEGNKLSYDELLDKMENTESCDDNDISVNNIDEDFFDFDFGCIGGTVTNHDGEAHLDCLQMYIDTEDGDCEAEDIDTTNI